MATLYVVGVGPGDPELITIKGEKILKSVNAIVSPVAKVGETSVAFETVRQFIDSNRQAVLPFLFPMTTNLSILEPAWRAAADEIVKRIDNGEEIAFITIGDPLFYATSIYLIDMVVANRPDINIEIIPGITSFCAAASIASFPLIERDGKFAVIAATAGIDAIEEALKNSDTVVILKVRPIFTQIVELIKRLDSISSILFAERVGSPQQLLLKDIKTIETHNPDYLSLMIIRK